MIPLGCVTGRFQPVHDQHLQLFGIALEACEHLIIAVTNPDPGTRRQEASSPHRHTAGANPFTYYERARLLDAAVRDRLWRDRVTIVPFDLTREECWDQYVPTSARQFVRAFSAWERQKAQWLERAGYAVTLLDGDPSNRASASDIRACMAAGDLRWRSLVPASIVPWLADLLERVPMEKRT